MISRLLEILAEVGKSATRWTSTDGSVVVVLPYGGRILGLFPPTSEENFFWTHPALKSTESALSFYASSDWHNSGGDRTWLGPEVDLFFPNFPNLDPYFQPREFDPGYYGLTTIDGSVILKNSFSSTLSRSKAAVELELTKRLTPALNPLRNIHLGEESLIEYAGYTLDTSLAITGSDQNAGPVGLWSLLQLPHGGDLLIPTLSKSKVTLYMGHVDESDLSIEDNLVRYKMRAQGEHKLGLPSTSLIGRAGYLHVASNGIASLVIRNFSVNPSGAYVDTPWARLDDPGAAIEACNINSSLGAFSELEYHSPAIGGRTGMQRCQDSSQVWAFRGPRELISAVARVLISPGA
jgi:hypothetical protein